MTGLAVVCGLAAEAKIAAGPGHLVIAAGGDARRLEAALDASSGVTGVISFGVAGGLRPGLVPGDAFLASGVFAPCGTLYPTDLIWTEAMAAVLARHGVGVRQGTIVGVSAPLADTDSKAAAHIALGASIVDMESHVAAAWAARNNARFAALRVVTDPAERSLPHAATVGMRQDGTVHLPAILKSLLKDPRQLPGLVRTGRDARAAFATLLRCRESLGPRFAFLDL